MVVRWSAALPASGGQPSAQSSGSVLRTLAQVDAIAMGLLPPAEWQRRQWLRLAPRYLPRPLRTERALSMAPAEAAAFERALREQLASGELEGPVELCLGAGPPVLLLRNPSS